MLQWSVGQIQKREREGGKIQFCFGCFKSERRSENTREEWRSWRASTKTTWGEKDGKWAKRCQILTWWKLSEKCAQPWKSVWRSLQKVSRIRGGRSRGRLQGGLKRACEPKTIWTKKEGLKRLRQSESSCERRRRAQKLKNDLEDGLQLWSQQVYFVKDNQNFLFKLYLKIYQRQKFKLRCEIQVQEVQEHNMRRAEEQVADGCLVLFQRHWQMYCVKLVFLGFACLYIF